MAMAARQALAARRNEKRVFAIQVVGMDLTAVAAANGLRMQVRLRPDTPGSPLIDLATVTNANAEGLRLSSVVTTGGVPTSTITGTINKTTMSSAASVPYSGEVGDDSRLAYALQIDGKTRLFGDFWALASAIDSDSAPNSRPVDFSPQSKAPAQWYTTTLTIADQDVISVKIDGADALGPLVQTATAAAVSSAADRLATELAATTAAGFVGGVMYPSAAAGLAATGDGQFFTVAGDGTNTYAMLYKNVAGAAEPQASYVSKEAYEGPGGAGFIGFQQDADLASQIDIEQALRQGWVIPQMFRQPGAVDDTTMMQALFASGKRRILIPEADYTIGASIVLPASTVIVASALSRFFAAANDIALFSTTDFTTGTRFDGGYADGNGYTGVTMFDLSNFRAEGAILRGQSGRNLDVMYYLRLLCWDLSIRDFYSQNCNRAVVIDSGCNAVTIDHPGINTFNEYGIDIGPGTEALPNVGINILGGYTQAGPIGIRDQSRSASINGTYFEQCTDADVFLDGAIMPIIQRSYHSASVGTVCVKARSTNGARVDNVTLHGSRSGGLFDFDDSNTYCRGTIGRTADLNVELGDITGLRINSSISGTLERGDLGFDVTVNKPYVTTGPDLGSIIQRGVANGYHDIGSGLGPAVNALRKEDGTFQLVGGGETFTINNLEDDQEFKFFFKAVGTPSTTVTVAGSPIDLTGASDGKRKVVTVTKVAVDGGAFYLQETPWK